ncbi:Protein of unknown function [Clostridium amylolyticum]|uniref:Cyclic nucleotide-binding protein n=1 Tax=Clostridium amylolyticum TaxID=1121298 RepID=A0A1M6GJX7_9CLOT|nr:DUF1003 domain-containing protein [Clostridium amylolyticum]SHJ10190.1 Protein of unknown function [Clostridium amylolyticum]
MDEKYDKEKIVKMILENKDSIEDIDEDIIHDLISGKVSKDINQIHQKKLTLGDRASDKISDFVGSWPFILIGLGLIALWIILNIVGYFVHFDPYPFILLNLFLSCLAGIQAPIIMMAQNRQEEKDRLRAKNDYKVNLKSEIIVQDLHNKVDEIMRNQEEILRELRELKK